MKGEAKEESVVMETTFRLDKAIYQPKMLLVTGLSSSRLCVYVGDGDNHEGVFELKVVAVGNRGRVGSLRLIELNSHTEFSSPR